MDTNNLKQTLQAWNTAYGKIQTVENTLDFYRTTYRKKIDKKELEANLVDLVTWEQYAYANKILLEMTFLLSNDQPYAGVILNAGNAIVKFIDEHNREYIRYVFGGEHKEGYLFLESLRYFTYPDNHQFYSSYRCETSTRYEFTPAGNLRVTKFDKDNYMTVDEAAHPVNVEANWEPYPELGKYEGLVKLKRWGDGDLLAGIDPNQPAPAGPF
nr:hypothetical protein [Pedobacter sp. ASV2]